VAPDPSAPGDSAPGDSAPDPSAPDPSAPGDSEPGFSVPGFSVPGGDFGLRLQQLAHLTADLAAADTIEAVVEVAVTRVAAAVRAVAVTLRLREDELLTLVGAQGVSAAQAERLSSVSVTDQTPMSEAARTGAPVLANDLHEIEARYPELRGELAEGRSVVCLPLLAGQKPLGVMALSFEQRWLPGPRELDFLTTFSDACAQAIRRIHAMQVAEERAVQLAFLAEASDELTRSLDYPATLRRVARLAVRALADWCAVDILADGELNTLAVEHVDPAKVAWAKELQERYPSDPHAPTGPPNVVRTGVSELIAEITDEMLVAGARDEEHLRLARELNLRSALVVPLVARGRTLGAITLVRAETDRAYSSADLAVAEDLGRRAGVAIDNAQLYSQTQDVALQLQRAVLPDRLDRLPGWQVAAYYSPGGHADVGGDFYDAVPLGDGRLAVFIGDVMGHGVAAAAAMAHIRAAVRAYLSVDPDPSKVAGKLDMMFARLQMSQLVSLAYGVLDQAAGELSLVCAGHHPPLLVAPDGSSRFAVAQPQRILGVGPDVRTATTWQLVPGSILLLYTDGLIERRTEGLDVGQQRLAEAASRLVAGALPAALDRLVAALHDPVGADDVTAIAVRIPGPVNRTGGAARA